MVDKRICEMRLDNRKATDIAQLIKKLIATHTTISTMESCTSGLIASMITDTEGASAIFPGGYVTYLNETKIFILSLIHILKLPCILQEVRKSVSFSFSYPPVYTAFCHFSDHLV